MSPFSYPNGSVAGLHSPETFLALAAIAVALLAARLRFRGLGWWEKQLALLGRRKWLAIAISAAAPVVIRLLLLPWFPAPVPRTHDEFSFLLGADTLLHGRVANPAHPMWVHFESMHIMARPSYMSAFPLGQAAVLAIGTMLGHPWIGVLLSCGLMCGTLCWMLQGWVPPRWALLGALLAVLRFGVSSYWMNSYWGGALAATGGALVLGAMPRIVRHPHWRDSIVMGIGFFFLANTRTFEGAVFCGLAVAATVPKIISARQVILPIALMLLVTMTGLLCYFANTTGDPLLPPYNLYRRTLTIAPHFLFQGVRPEPHYNNRDMRHFFTALEMHRYQTARDDLFGDLIAKTASYWRFYVGPVLSIPLLGLLFARRWGRARNLPVMFAGFSLALAPQVWHNAHYAAPATGLILLLVMLGIRVMRTWTLGMCYVRVLPLACAAMLLVQISAGSSPDDAAGWRWPDYGGRLRAGLLHELQKMDGSHLVLVRYGPRHDAGDEWVYNGADIDGSKVVWARELDRGSNLHLLEYFKGRRIWLVEPDIQSPRLIPYEQAPLRPMLFIPPGAPGIESMRSVEDIKIKLYSSTNQTCDVWNYYFTELTGVSGPNTSKGCYDGGGRTQIVSFGHWFNWLLRMRE